MKITAFDVIKSGKYKTGSLANCQQKCLITKNCKAIVWGLATNPKGFAGDCFLKTSGSDKDIKSVFGFDTYTVPSAKACAAAKASAAADKKPAVVVPK